MTKSILKKLIDTAAGRVPADVLFRGGVIADVYSGRFVPGELAVSGGMIAAVGEPGDYRGLETVDLGGAYALPGFIDGHFHIESTFLCPPELSGLLVPHGASTIVSDPHEAANVAGLAGLDYMLAASCGLPLDILFMAPSCVPCAPHEHNGAFLDAAALEAPLDEGRILGLGEFMDYPAVIEARGAALDKILAALRRGKFIDGHSPGLGGKGLAAYAAGMIRTDHECSTVEEMTRRIGAGMYVMLRQGSACRDLENLLPGVTPENSRRCLLCSDDLQPRTVFEEGHLDNDLRICVRHGLPPMTALRMATLNPAECYGLRDRGGFAPGLRADIVLVDDLRDFRVRRVFIKGKLAAEDGRLAPGPAHSPAQAGDALRNTFHIGDFSARTLAVSLKSDHVWVIDLRPGGIVTGKGTGTVRLDAAGNFVFDPASGIAKIAVVERYRGSGAGVGFIRGYGIRRGAAAISVSHDSHNIIVAGTNDADMALAVERIARLGGGAVLALDGGIIEEMPLPIGGLLSGKSAEWVRDKLTSLEEKAAGELGVSAGVEPLMSLCFMSLPVIPELRITDQGLFDTAARSFIPLEADCGVHAARSGVFGFEHGEKGALR